MDIITLLGGVAVLVTAVALGAVVHESFHMVVLRAIGVPFDVNWLPGGASGLLDVGLFKPLATVTPRRVPGTTPVWGLRLAALAPLAMATPMGLVLAGVVPDPTAPGNLYLALATVGWFGSALPSPRDFSLFWRAGRVVAGDDHAV